MCGITGFFCTTGPLEVIEQMTAALTHRGPDTGAVWTDPQAGLALGHRRLAIQDLSDAGAQPMRSPSGRFYLVFNGEIYNHLELRQDLPGHVWRGHSDTETLLACIEAWGLQKTLKRCTGMFAFAVWDIHEGLLFLARDRMGEKPLYYGWQKDTFLFASELKALRLHPAFTGEIDRTALTLFIRHGYVPAPHAIYQNIFKLLPGHFLCVKPQERSLQIHTYWSATHAALQGKAHPFAGSEADALDLLEQQLLRTLSGQMLADVPLGAFLSGGIDSSSIAALMQKQSTQPIQTFSIGFTEKAYNEAPHAKAVAAHLGTAHTELYVTPEEAQEVITHLPTIYDEPFADSSQIPTFLVARLARQHVTVSLSGDGGDELFSGYNRYVWCANIWKALRRIPQPARTFLARLFTSLPPQGWNQIFRILTPLLPARFRYSSPGDKIHKLAGILDVQTFPEIYQRLISQWQTASALVIGGLETPRTLLQPELFSGPGSLEQCMMLCDQNTYLPDDILVKVDRAAMAVSLETRVPFLDHHLVEFAWSLPFSFKIRNGQSKWLLRQLLYRHVPQELIERPKMGFGIPLDAWLRGPLRPWAEALLDEKRLAQENYFAPQLVQKTWQEHLRGTRNWAYALWNVLMFQAWLEKEPEAPSAPSSTERVFS